MNFSVKHLAKIPKFDQTYSSLISEDQSILKELSKLKKSIKNLESSEKINLISSKFEIMHKSWIKFYESIKSNISYNKTQEKKYQKGLKLRKNVLTKLSTNKKRIRSQEIVLKKCETRLGRSLGKIKGLWQENLSEMESSLKFQRETLKRVRKNYFNAMNLIEKEINEVLFGTGVPALNLENLKSSKKSSKSKATEDEILSNQSAFSFFTEDIASFRSYSSRQHKKVNAKAEKSDLKVPKVNTKNDPNTLNFSKSDEKTSEKKNKNSKSAYEISYKNKHTLIKTPTEQSEIDYEEIKNALIILKRANLINNNGNQELLKIADLIKDPENSSKVELMLQLIDIENKKNKKTFSSSNYLKTLSKPSTPSHKKQIFRSQNIDNEGTSREKYKFTEDKILNRTILSNEILVSPKNEDIFENSFKFYDKVDELKDVKLEDLLNVTNVIDELGLISADNSIINEVLENDSAKCDTKERFSLYDEIPVKMKCEEKISKK